MSRARMAVLTAIVGVLAGVLVFIAVAALTGTGRAKSNLGSDRFVIGNATPLAKLVQRHGPLLFQDLAGGKRDVFVQHLAGQRPTAGWVVFEAHAPGGPRRCQLRWQPKTRQFRDTCTRTLYPADGTGLVAYQTEVDAKGKLSVDLRKSIPATTTTSPPP